MIPLMSPVLSFCVVVMLAASAWRLASERDRLPELWTGLLVVAAAGAAFGAWRWLISAGSDTGLLAAGFAIWSGPPTGAAAILALLYWMPPGRPRIGGSVPVRIVGGESTGGE